MGGKLFNLPRMPRAEYLLLEHEMRLYLDKKLSGEYLIPRAYGNKPDFGDMDIIIPSFPEWGSVRQEIIDELGIAQHRSAGHVYSTVYKGLQTDFFTTPKKYLEGTYTFMSFNDLGNFIGRMCRRFNLKYGEEGLSYVYRRSSNENYKRDLELTRDFRKICTFLGLDYDVWVKGFDSLEHLYTWTIQSPYFSVTPYLDDIKGILKGRTQERTTVTKFVSWLGENNISQRPEFAERSYYLPMILEYFPEANLQEQLQQEHLEEQRDVELSRKFSGKLVMKLLPHLEGKELGSFIMNFKASFEDFETFVLSSSELEIEKKVLEVAKLYSLSQ
jgi:hypothetical protein